MTCIVLHICCKLQPMVFFGKSLPSKMLLVSRNVYQVSLVYLIFVPEDMNPILSWPLAITSHLQRREHQGIYLTTLLNIQNHTLSSKTFKNIMQKNNQDLPWHNIGFCLLIPNIPSNIHKKNTTNSILGHCFLFVNLWGSPDSDPERSKAENTNKAPNPNPFPEESV